jgi:lipoate-protein ligase A
MTLDEVLLTRAIENSEQLPTVRIYEWSSPALSVGKNFEIDNGLLRRCEEANVDVVMRPTGGGAVLHKSDVTYSVIAPAESDGVLSTYHRVARGIIDAFALVGIDSEVIEHQSTVKSLACFASPTGADIASRGRKICGSAQLRREGFFLQQGSIPLEDVREETALLLGSPHRDDSGWVHLFRPEVSAETLVGALVTGFEQLWAPVVVGDCANPRGFV